MTSSTGSTTGSTTGNQSSVGAAQIGALLLALTTAGVHLYLFLIEGFLGNGAMLPIYQLLFVGNVLAYVTLAAALVVPVPLLARVRSLVRVGLISIAVASIAAYFYVGVTDIVGNVTKIIEVLLILVLAAQAAASEGGDDAAGRFANGGTGAAVQVLVGVVVGLVLFGILTPFMI